MKVIFRATKTFVDAARADLRRAHPHALERVAFITARAARGIDGLVLVAERYHQVADEDYVRDPRVGAMMGQEAIRKALELALFEPVSVLHVHLHEHKGPPAFSRVDLAEQPKFVPDFFKVRPEMPHGALLLSADGFNGRIWASPTHIVPLSEVNVVGSPLGFHFPPRAGPGIVV